MNRCRKRVHTSLSYLVVAAAAALSSTASATSQIPSEPRSVSIPLVIGAPDIDGHLDDAVWQSAARVTDFIQTEPSNGEPSTQRTVVFIAYNTHALLIGARLEDTDSSRIAANEYRRDADLEADDAFEVFLDTFRDRRNAFYFATNPAGAQRDALVRNEGAVLNYEWDGIWDVASSRDAGGWTTEISIPFSTLRFRAGSTDGWGVNFGRRIARNRERSYWTPIDRDWGFDSEWRASAYGTLKGLAQARPRGRLQIKPYVLGGLEHDLLDEPNDADFRRDVGLDAKVAVTSTLMADFTVNTDFAQVEADQEQVNLTRFPLFFPEKREFFLENAGLFHVGELTRFEEPPATLLFFSRRIGLYDDEYEVPILAGARLTGKIGATDIGVFDIVTRETQIDEDIFVPQTNFAAARVKRDILSRSSVGALVLSKSPADEGASNQVVAADATIAPNQNTRFHGFASKSFTSGLSGSDHALGVDGNWESDKGFVSGSYVDIGDNFNSEMGFLQRTGIRKVRGTAMVSPRPGKLGIRQLWMGMDHIYITDREGKLESQANNIGPFIMFENGAFLFAGWLNLAEGLTEPFEIRDGVEIPVGTYRFNQGVIQYMGDRSRVISANAGVVWGGFFDGRIRSFNIAGQLRPHRRLAVQIQYFRNHVDLPLEGGNFVTNLGIARALFAFSPKAYIRGLFQYNDDDQEARANILFRYTYRPGADIFVVLNEERDTDVVGWNVTNRELLVKMTFYFAVF
jgi:hypothetical protein